MALHENYRDSTLAQRMIAVGGCVLGGIIVLILGLMALLGSMSRWCAWDMAFGQFLVMPLSSLADS